MAPGPRARRSPRRNPPVNGQPRRRRRARWRRSRASDGSGSPAPAPAPSRGPTPAPGKRTDEDLQRITKLCMESFIQGQGQTKAHPEPRERPLKARFPDLYYGKSHMDCYHFCQQCEDGPFWHRPGYWVQSQLARSLFSSWELSASDGLSTSVVTRVRGWLWWWFVI